MQSIQYLSLCLLGLVLGQTFALPQHPVYVPQLHDSSVKIEERKFAEKPNAMKKVAINDDLDDVSTNSIQVINHISNYNKDKSIGVLSFFI